jgi:hypothetical protein
MSVVEGRDAESLARAARVLSVRLIYIYETLDEVSLSRVFRTFLRDLVFSIWRPIAAHRAPGGNE